ncbi:PREDICTED: uncharacterized protein LOC107089594 [Cyprinodon variegatus]|uniref:uncharacterized protein LOC107089594 n=1 Tax=Cyprinodon variegatus TaxID=28743 RepID=UPI000742B2C7|nr:PREDICTED: uncharacterized protein LOC107089594 [Cyprinodon variegatus]
MSERRQRGQPDCRETCCRQKASDGRRRTTSWLHPSSPRPHKAMDVQQDLYVSSWSDLDLHPLSPEDPCRLRILSAKICFIVKNREMEKFESVVEFLDTTHRLLPRLVPAIKHMKVLFGLKTMIIMWMLKEGRGMVHIMSKIIQFFPSKLPQYEDQCSQREMFLMRKNHADFKSLAQSLAIDKERLKDYIKNELEQQYGERYAKKVEERLLDYLQELQKVSPQESLICKIMNNQSAENGDDEVLLEGKSSDPSAVRTLLSCGASTSCSPTALLGCPIKSQLQSEGEPLLGVDGGDLQVGPCLCPEDLQLLKSVSSSDRSERLHPEREEAAQKDGKREGGDEEQCVAKTNERPEDGSSSPQFCSKHQRWVKSILRGCPDDCSEELLQQQLNASSSPVLFQSSSSTPSSSQDLTPSHLVFSSSDPTPPSHTSTHLQISEAANTGGKQRPGSEASEGSVLPTMQFPVVRLVDIASFCRNHVTPESKQLSADHFSTLLEVASCSSRPRTSSVLRTSGNQNSSHDLQTALGNQHISTRSCSIPGQHTASRLSLKSRRKAQSQPFGEDRGPFPPSSQQIQNSKLDPQTPNNRTFQSKLPSGSSFRTSYLQERPPSQTQLELLQTYVGLTRLSAKEILQATEGRASARRAKPSVQHSAAEEWAKEVLQDGDCFFDVNALYSSDSSSSEFEDSGTCDPTYRPHVNRRRFLSENQAVYSLRK